MTSLFLLWNSYNTSLELSKKKEEKEKRELQEKRDRDADIARQNAARALKDANVKVPEEAAPKWYTIGTMNASDGYRLLVTLTSKGAGIERVELVQQVSQDHFTYRSLAHRGGYLGYLAPTVEEKVGLRIHTIPIGSPAGNAVAKDARIAKGLQPDDVIIKLNDDTITSVRQFDLMLEKIKAGTKVSVTVLRGLPVPKSDPIAELVKDSLSATDAKADQVSRTEAEVSSKDELAVDEPKEKEQLNAPETVPGADETAKTTDVAQTGATIVFDCVLSEPPLDVVRMEDDEPTEGVVGNRIRPSAMTSLAKVDSTEIISGLETIPGLEQTLHGNWESKPIDVENGMGVEFSLPLEGYLAGAGARAKLELVKRYRITKATEPGKLLTEGYHIDLETIVRNQDTVPHSVSLRQEGLAGVSLEGWWYSIKLSPDFFNAAGARDVMLANKSNNHQLITRRAIQDFARAHPAQPDTILFGQADTIDNRSLKYIGVDQQYFTTAFLAHPDAANSLDDLSQAASRAVADVEKLKPYKDIATNVSFWFDTKSDAIPAGEEKSKRYVIFAGPKDPNLLASYGLNGSIYFGWTIFEMVARPLSFILHTFYWIVGNYGIAIIMLTVLVRSCMFPFSRRAAIMGQRMQEMGPEMKKITELYKDDMQKRGQEMQALYKKYNVNPMASCLPVFIQLPIFIGLYRCVSVDIGLRQQALIPGLEWCSNLAGPDMLAHWPTWMPDVISGRGTGWFGPYINLLPIITISLFIIQQKVLMPKATDEQQRLTQQMMMFMTIFMGVLFFKVPAGLCLYFITSSIWSLVERKLIKRFVPALPVSSTADLATVDGKVIAGATNRPLAPFNQPKAKPINNKSPETISDVVNTFKELWSKRKKEPEQVKPAVSTPAARKKLRKKK